MKPNTRYIRELIGLIQSGGVQYNAIRSPIAEVKMADIRAHLDLLIKGGYAEYSIINPTMVSRLTQRGLELNEIVCDRPLLRKMRPFLEKYRDYDCDTIIAVADYVRIVLMKKEV